MGKAERKGEQQVVLYYTNQAWVAAGVTWELKRWRQHHSWERPFTLPGIPVVAYLCVTEHSNGFPAYLRCLDIQSQFLKVWDR